MSPGEWLLATVAAVGIGVSKSGLPGVSLLHVLVFAHLFTAIGSTGVVLPMLVAGDLGAVLLFRRHAIWIHVLRTLPPALIGIISGWWLMRQYPQAQWNPVIGGIVLSLALLQLLRTWRPAAFANLPDSPWFGWGFGLVAGLTTMLANAAGPVMGLYLVAMALPKEAFVGTSAWFFLIINVLKLPFSLNLGLIHGDSLRFNAILIPPILVGLFLGRALVARIPQKIFDSLILAFAATASLRLLWPSP
jgi:uncharacterized membrane protein YfcA